MQQLPFGSTVVIRATFRDPVKALIDPTSVKVLLRPRVDEDPPSIEEFVVRHGPRARARKPWPVQAPLGAAAGRGLALPLGRQRSWLALPGRGLVHGGQQRLLILISTKMVSP